MRDLEELCRQHFNEPLISFEEIGRVIGYGEDNYDCYIIVRKNDGSVIWNTMVGGYVFLDCLKGQNEVIPSEPSFEGEIWDDYYRLDSSLQLNNCPKEEKFIVEIENDRRNQESLSQSCV